MASIVPPFEEHGGKRSAKIGFVFESEGLLTFPTQSPALASLLLVFSSALLLGACVADLVLLPSSSVITVSEKEFGGRVDVATFVADG